MKTSTLQSRIDKNLRTKSGSIRVNAEDVINLISNPTTRIHPYHYAGWSKGYTLLGNSHITEGLRSIGIDFTTGNDAPHGGKQGYYIELTKKGQNQVKEWNAERIAKIESEKEAQKIRIEAAKSEKLQKLAELKNTPSDVSDEAILINFFENESHPCKPEVLAAKMRVGGSWNDLRHSLSA